MVVLYASLIVCMCCHMILGQQEEILKPTTTISPTQTIALPTPTPEPVIFGSNDSCLLINCGSSKIIKSCSQVKGPESRKIVVTVDGDELLCDTKTDNGGWTIIQRRFNGTEDFFRGWGYYKYGFGSLNGEFWLGLEKIHKITTKQCHELRIDMRYEKRDYFAKYSYFKVLGEDDKYRLDLGFFSGNVENNLAIHNGKPFSTKDNDNDDTDDNCSKLYSGAWWYAGCHKVNLNGLWSSNLYGKGLTWQFVTGFLDSLDFTEMKIRPCY